MLRKLNLLFLSILLSVSYSVAQSGLGTIQGTIKDAKFGEPIMETKITLKQGGQTRAEVVSDIEGKFKINSVNPGVYTLELVNTSMGYASVRLEDITVSPDAIRFLDDLTMDEPQVASGNSNESNGGTSSELEGFVVKKYRNKLIDPGANPSGAVIAREDFEKMATRSAAGAAAMAGGVTVNEGSGGISMRGGREDDTYFYIDGIKTRGSSNLPKSAIQEISVLTGGIGANYGDVTGGIISITTRGPSDTYFGSAELVSSGFYLKGKDANGYDGKVFGLDKYGYNLFEGMLSGPLWMQRDSNNVKSIPRLGFLLSVSYLDELDSRPMGNGGNYRIKKEARDYLLENPLRQSSTGSGTFHNANFLRASDFEQVAYRMNARRRTLSASGKIDVNTGPSVNLTFGGSLNYNAGKDYSYSSSLLNFSNFGNYDALDFRVYGRLTQRFKNEPRDGSSSKISGANYSLMVDYSKTYRSYYDDKHGFDIFNYGHVGYFETQRVNNYEFNATTGQYVHTAFRDVEVAFRPSDKNPELAAITSQYFNIFKGNPTGNYENLFQIQLGNGLRNGDTPGNVYSVWNNIGTPYNEFLKQENDQFRVTGSGSVQIGSHQVSLGFEYEQRFDRGWGSGSNGPIGIWEIARQYTNSHIRELDFTKATVENLGNFTQITYDRANSGYAYQSGTGTYGGQKNNDGQYFFDYNLRQKLGLNVAGTDYIDIDKYDPNTFSLDMFSPDELFNSGNSFISYYGFDHTGKKVRGKTDINNYFNEYDENGNYKRFIGSFQPIYVAGYLMDRFTINSDLVFNVGVRVDVFNANQSVLKDPYLMYEARDVSQVKALYAKDPSQYSWANIPTSMGDDYVVYVDDVNNPNKINGYRSGDTWYNAEGIVVEDAKVLEGPAGIAPWLVDPTNKTINQNAFEEYKPQINVMPRLSFTFPISNTSLFFAHYDILTKRPTSGLRFNPFDYQFIETRSVIINNPNLKPETTIDYELGFQQVLSSSSSLKISAFYREQRNNVQLVNIFRAYPAQYRTYGNRDFGTVKGLTLSYDLRRTGNVRMTAAYTLQFAEGTGSDATTALGLINAGQPNLRNIFPYTFDQRHSFAISFDYRYRGGKEYNGPSIGETKLFENMGLNVMANIYSGSPYSRYTGISNDASFSPIGSSLDGTMNGSRKPWSNRLDMQLDRTFELTLNKGEGTDKSKKAFLNVYIRATNLFNAMNVLNVYRATGNWNDDGYLAAAQFQSVIQNQLDEQAFRDYYTMKVQNANNISSPRTVRLGVKFDF